MTPKERRKHGHNERREAMFLTGRPSDLRWPAISVIQRRWGGALEVRVAVRAEGWFDGLDLMCARLNREWPLGGNWSLRGPVDEVNPERDTNDPAYWITLRGGTARRDQAREVADLVTRLINMK
jgi:hypothetical protein